MSTPEIIHDQLPSGWREVPLSAVADLRISGVDKLLQPSEEPVRLCNYVDVYNSDYITGAQDFMHATATPAEIDRFRLQVGDVIITKDSEKPDDIGVPAVVDYAAPDLICGYHLALLRPRLEEVDPTFLAKQLSHPRLASYFGQQANGTTRYGLPTGAIANAPLWLPPLTEQQDIASLLRRIDEAVARAEAVIAKLRQVHAGLLHDLLTRGLDEHSELRDPIAHPEQFKDSPLGRIPRTWQVGPFRDFSPADRPYLKTGPFGSSLKQEHWVSEGIPVVTIGSLAEGEIIRSELLHVSQSTAAGLAPYVLEPGDIVFSRVADVGRSAVITEAERGWIMSSNLMRISVDQKRAVPEYVQANIAANRQVRRQIRALVNAAGRDVASAPILNQIQLCWAPRSEQERIMSVLRSIAIQIEAKQVELKKLQQLKSGLTSDLLTGRVRVSESIIADSS